MKQCQVVNYVSEDGKIKVYVDTDTALGQLHDFLMLIKGNVVDMMVAAHKEEQAYADAQKQIETKEEE